MNSDAEIRKYLVEKQGMNPFFAEELLEKLKNHSDIFNEFIDFIKTEEYPESGVKSGDYSAKILSEKLPHLKPQIVYEFLIGLRDKPEKYEGFIKEGALIR